MLHSTRLVSVISVSCVRFKRKRRSIRTVSTDWDTSLRSFNRFKKNSPTDKLIELPSKRYPSIGNGWIGPDGQRNWSLSIKSTPTTSSGCISKSLKRMRVTNSALVIYILSKRSMDLSPFIPSIFNIIGNVNVSTTSVTGAVVGRLVPYGKSGCSANTNTKVVVSLIT